MHRVQKLISNFGYTSRRKAEELIIAGRVKVNDKLITIGDKANETDKITIDGKIISKPKKIYLMFYKPVGCVTALEDIQYKTIMDYIDIPERVFPIGRLDYNTEGLLLLTNDGDFANNIMHPSFEINKTYLVTVDRDIDKRDLHEIEKGVVIDDKKTSKAKTVLISPKVLQITIHEGRNRIVRRIMNEFDYRVNFLKRIKVGNLSLGSLEVGNYRKLSKKEMERIFE